MRAVSSGNRFRLVPSGGNSPPAVSFVAGGKTSLVASAVATDARTVTAARLNAALADGRRQAHARHEDPLTASVRGVLDRAGRTAAERFKANVLAHSLTAAGTPWTPPHADEIIDVDQLVSQLRGKTDAIRLLAVEAAMTPALAAAGLDFDVTNPYVGGVLSRTGSHISHIAETTRANVLRIVRAAYDEGLSIPDTAAAIRVGMTDASAARAVLIARTELSSVANGGALAAVRIVSDETGLPFAKTWRTAPGAEHPRHELVDGLDGQSRALGAPFDVSGDALMFPGDPSGPVDAVANCRCTLSAAEGYA